MTALWQLLIVTVCAVVTARASFALHRTYTYVQAESEARFLTTEVAPSVSKSPGGFHHSATASDRGAAERDTQPWKENKRKLMTEVDEQPQQQQQPPQQRQPQVVVQTLTEQKPPAAMGAAKAATHWQPRLVQQPQQQQQQQQSRVNPAALALAKSDRDENPALDLLSPNDSFVHVVLTR